jgi:hypothetical protein
MSDQDHQKPTPEDLPEELPQSGTKPAEESVHPFLPEEEPEAPVENGSPFLEDEQVSKRLVGETAPKKPIIGSPLKYKKNRLRRSEVKPQQPGPEPQSDVNLVAPQTTKKEVEEPDFDDVRTIATQGYNPSVPEEFEEVKPPAIRRQKWSKWLSFPKKWLTILYEWFNRQNKLKKSGILVGVLLVVGLYVFLIVSFSPRLPSPVVPTSAITLISPIPIPASVVLPDGQSFSLGLGTPENGSWTPKGAEWLKGTQVPCWLALPWNKGLESAVRAYKVDNQIQLHMSNGDILYYRFQSVQELSPEEMGTFHTNTTDLLIVLSRPNASTLLIIVAVP